MPQPPAPPVYVLSSRLPNADAVEAAVRGAGGRAEVRLPFPADQTREYGPVADHFLAAAYVGELLARHCASVDAWEDVSGGSYSTYVGGGHGEFVVFTCAVRDARAFAADLEALAPLAPEVTPDDQNVNEDDDEVDDEDEEEDQDGGASDRSELLLEAYDAVVALVDARNLPEAPRPVCPEFVNWAFVYLPSTDEPDAEEAAAREARWPGYAEREFVPYPDAMRRRTRPRARKKPPTG